MNNQKTIEWQKNFSKMLLSILDDKGLSQRQLSDMIGISNVTLSRYINIQRMPKVTTIIDISKVLNIPLLDLLVFDNSDDTKDILKNIDTTDLLKELYNRVIT